MTPILTPASTAIEIRQVRTPPMPPTLAYALLAALDPLVRPYGYPSLQALARRIHRDRGDDELRLATQRVRFRDGARDVTEVLAVDAGGRTRRIGFAWHGGRDWRALEAELQAQVPAASWGA